MARPRLAELKERLLIAGIAPTHAQRYVRELRDHHDDLYRAAVARGLTPSAAEHEARCRLGSEDALVESMLAQPELRSMTARFPAMAFGIAPLLTWFGLWWISARLLQRVGAKYMLELQPRVPLESLVHFVQLYFLGLVRILPVLLIAVIFWSAMRRRSRACWPILGAALVAIATASINVVIDDCRCQVGMFTTLAPGLRTTMLVGYEQANLSAVFEGLTGALWLLAPTLVPYALWSARRTAVR